MSNFKIITSVRINDLLEGLNFSKLNVTGKLFIRLNGTFLPTEGWEDFVIIVITWWLDGIVTLIDKKRVVLDFMDDDYKIELSLKNGILIFTFYHDGLSEFYIRDEQLSFKAFSKELISNAKRLISTISNFDVSLLNKCNDFSELKNNLKKAEIALRSYPF